jgi:hypothetical protein
LLSSSSSFQGRAGTLLALWAGPIGKFHTFLTISNIQLTLFTFLGIVFSWVLQLSAALTLGRTRSPTRQVPHALLATCPPHLRLACPHTPDRNRACGLVSGWMNDIFILFLGLPREASALPPTTHHPPSAMSSPRYRHHLRPGRPCTSDKDGAQATRFMHQPSAAQSKGDDDD